MKTQQSYNNSVCFNGFRRFLYQIPEIGNWKEVKSDSSCRLQITIIRFLWDLNNTQNSTHNKEQSLEDIYNMSSCPCAISPRKGDVLISGHNDEEWALGDTEKLWQLACQTGFDFFIQELRPSDSSETKHFRFVRKTFDSVQILNPYLRYVVSTK